MQLGSIEKLSPHRMIPEEALSISWRLVTDYKVMPRITLGRMCLTLEHSLAAVKQF